REQPFALVLLDAQMPEMDGFMLVEKIKTDPRLRETVLMMLSSAAQHSDAQRCREMGVSAYLTKPIKQSELFDALITLLAKNAGVAFDAAADHSSLALPAGSESPIRNILLAEDNPVNQRVAIGILEKRGHHVTAVQNGLEALQAVQV